MHEHHTTSNKKRIVAIDFFCGCGGVTNGMKKAGINVVGGFDNDPVVKYAYKRNNRPAEFFEVDIKKKRENVKIIKQLLKGNKHDILVFTACAPCQPFSLHNRKHKYDSRKSLMLKFIDIVRALSRNNKPDVIFVENVGPMKKRGKNIVKKVLNQLSELNYDVLNPKVINAADYGVPQNRKRLIFIAVQKSELKNKDKFNWEYFYKNYREKAVSVKMAIGKTPPIPHGLKINNSDPLHITRMLSAVNLEKIKKITKPGAGREMWGKKDLLKCYKKHKGHKDVYGRMSWENPAPTLTCKCISISNGRFGHPEQDRAISLREAAILQTLDKYIFEKPIYLNRVAAQIGNAVPPKLAQKFGLYIKELV